MIEQGCELISVCGLFTDHLVMFMGFRERPRFALPSYKPWKKTPKNSPSSPSESLLEGTPAIVERIYKKSVLLRSHSSFYFRAQSHHEGRCSLKLKSLHLFELTLVVFYWWLVAAIHRRRPRDRSLLSSPVPSLSQAGVPIISKASLPESLSLSGLPHSSLPHCGLPCSGLSCLPKVLRLCKYL